MAVACTGVSAPDSATPGQPDDTSDGVGALSEGPTYLPVPKIAELLALRLTRVHQLIRDRSLIAVRTGGVLCVPAEFIADGEIVKGLTGTITLLSDAGYRDPEIVDWLFQRDDSLPGTPIAALREHRGRDVHRRAQTAGY